MKIRWEHVAFAVVAVLVVLLDGGAIPDGPWHKAAEHLVALAGLAGIYVGRPLRAGRSDALPLPDPRPGVASGPLSALACFGALVAGGCTTAERARIRDGLITTSIGAVNCAAPGLQAGINAAVVQLLGSAVSGRGAGTPQEWRALGLELAKVHGLPAAHCAAEVAATELAKFTPAASSPPVAAASPAVVGFVQPHAGTRAQASGGALGIEASSGSAALREDEPAGRARAAALWLSQHHREW